MLETHLKTDQDGLHHCVEEAEEAACARPSGDWLPGQAHAWEYMIMELHRKKRKTI